MTLVVACSSPSAPTTAPPDVRGTWGSPGLSWSWAESYTYAPETSTVGGCAGELVVERQDGQSFQGRYLIECVGSGPASGRVLDGGVDRNGQLTFRLAPEQGWDPGLGPRAGQWDCAGGGDALVFEGSVSGDSLDVRHLENLSCPPGRVVVNARFRGTRQ